MKYENFERANSAKNQLDKAVAHAEAAAELVDLLGDAEEYQAVHSAIANLIWARRHLAQQKLE